MKSLFFPLSGFLLIIILISKGKFNTALRNRIRYLTSPRSRISATEGQSVQSKLLFVETGFGCDQHGQNSTKAAVRACRNAIEFNSLPSLKEMIPGGKENMILRVQVAVPDPHTVDISQLLKVFPYGKVVATVTEGGMRASSGIVLPEMGDLNDDMIIAVAAVYVGY
jgi:uncharacterized protein (TIGR02058 family)